MKNYSSEDYWNISRLISERQKSKPKISGDIQKIQYKYSPNLSPEKIPIFPGMITEIERITYSNNFTLSEGEKNGYLIAFIYSGAISFSTNVLSPTTVSTNTLFLLQNSTSFILKQINDTPLDILLIRIDGQIIDTLGPLLCPHCSTMLHFDNQDVLQLNMMFENIISLISSQSQTNLILISDIISRLLTTVYMKQQFENTITNKTLYPKWFLISHNFIEENLNKDLSIKKLSSLCEISESQYYKKFKAYTGMSPYQYIIKIRLEKAAILLTTTKIQIKSIAMTTGFQSSNHFANHFRKQYGMLPNEYRQKSKELQIYHNTHLF